MMKVMMCWIQKEKELKSKRENYEFWFGDNNECQVKKDKGKNLSIDSKEPFTESLPIEIINNKKKKVVRSSDLIIGDRFNLKRFEKKGVFSADNDCLFKTFCLLINAETNLKNAMRKKIVDVEKKYYCSLFRGEDLEKENERLDNLIKSGEPRTKKKFKHFTTEQNLKLLYWMKVVLLTLYWNHIEGKIFV